VRITEKSRTALADPPSGESYLTPAQAGRVAPHTGRPYSPGTVIRWIVRGARARNGARIKLQAVKTPRGWLTSSGWVYDFFSALSSAETSTPAPLAKERAQHATDWLRNQGF
jgi:hypothetical protein